MSKYINYENVSGGYDCDRYASGVETMTFILAGMLKKKPEEISILEAGCGTGNYSLGFLENGIGKISMIDASSGMLEVAKRKVERYGDRVVEVKRHNLPTMPFPNDSFDVVTFIQVLHHLDTSHLNKVDDSISAKEKYKNLHTAIKEAYRVLKPHGVLLIDHIFEKNVEAHWLSLAPTANSLHKEAYMPEEDLIHMLKEENYQNLLYVTRPGTSYLKRDPCENPEIILDKEWRNHDSAWSFAERTGELTAVLDLIQRKKDEGKLTEFAKEKGKLQQIVGLSTILVCQKPKQNIKNNDNLPVKNENKTLFFG